MLLNSGLIMPPWGTPWTPGSLECSLKSTMSAFSQALICLLVEGEVLILAKSWE